MEVAVAVLDRPLVAAISDPDDVNLKGESNSPSGRGSQPTTGPSPHSDDFRALREHPAPKWPKLETVLVQRPPHLTPVEQGIPLSDPEAGKLRR